MTPTHRYPPQVAYIIGNEGCERFSFYGMKNMLTQFLMQYFLLPKGTAEANYHLFVSAVYFCPLLGGYIADRFFGKYHTILWLSLVYCVGHGCLAAFDDYPLGFYVGLGLIALGSGGIKPCISAFVGDQFTAENKHLVKRVFGLFYWIINFGSFFATLTLPKVLPTYGPSVAFGIPGILMVISTVIFWLGRKLYVNVPPTGPNPHSFLRVTRDELLRRAPGTHPPEMVEGARSVVRIMVAFAPVCFFWALFDQKGSTWVTQANAMDRTILSYTIENSQMQVLNPLLVMILVPLTGSIVYPALERRGWRLQPLWRMTAGMFFAGASFVAAGLIQAAIDRGAVLSVLWQVGPYILLTLGEVLVSVTGLEFAYSQAPRQMKGTIMSFWSLTVTVGNLLTAGVSRTNVFSGSGQFFFYAALIGVAGGVFAAIARTYKSVEHYQKPA